MPASSSSSEKEKERKKKTPLFLLPFFFFSYTRVVYVTTVTFVYVPKDPSSGIHNVGIACLLPILPSLGRLGKEAGWWAEATATRAVKRRDFTTMLAYFLYFLCGCSRGCVCGGNGSNGRDLG